MRLYALRSFPPLKSSSSFGSWRHGRHISADIDLLINTFQIWPDNPIFVFSGPNRLPAGGEERPGELEERPGEEDQNVGVRSEAREVGV